jgi:hypothetical protein
VRGRQKDDELEIKSKRKRQMMIVILFSCSSSCPDEAPKYV